MKNSEDFAKALFANNFSCCTADIEREQEKEQKDRHSAKNGRVGKAPHESYLGFMDAGFNEKQVIHTFF